MSVQSCSIALAVTILLKLVILQLFYILDIFDISKKQTLKQYTFPGKIFIIPGVITADKLSIPSFNFPVLSYSNAHKEFISDLQQPFPVINMENGPLYTFSKRK